MNGGWRHSKVDISFRSWMIPGCNDERISLFLLLGLAEEIIRVIADVVGVSLEKF